MPAGSPLTQARRIGTDSCPLAAAIPCPVDIVHMSRECRVSVLLCPQEHFKLTLSSPLETRLGQAAPLVVAMEAILAACPLVVEMEAVAEGPCEGLWLFVMPRGSLSFQASPGGLLVPVGCPVLFVWPWSLVMYCSVCLAPEGSWYPLTSPGKFSGGGRKGSGCRGRAEGTEATSTRTTCHGLLSSLHRHGLLSSLHRHGLLSSLHRHGLQSCQLRHGLRIVCSALEVPVLCSCPCLSWGASRAPAYIK